MRWGQLEAQPCSLARTVAIIGDRWTLLILRDCFLRVRRFDDFQSRLGIGRPILADRLRKLVHDGVLEKVKYQENPTRHEYRLTRRGLDLHPIILSIVHWGDVHLSGQGGRPLLHRHEACGEIFDPVLSCSACGEAVTPQSVQVLEGPGARALDAAPLSV